MTLSCLFLQIIKEKTPGNPFRAPKVSFDDHTLISREKTQLFQPISQNLSLNLIKW